MKRKINFNKVVSVFLAFSILLSMVPSTVKAEDSDVLYYKVSEDEKTLTLTMNRPEEFISPSSIKASKIENVIIEEGIDRIGQTIRPGWSNVKNVKMPDSLKTIGACAFYAWRLLTDIDIPDGVTTIENHAFIDCVSLKKNQIT